MSRLVEINIPMFIGIILLITIITGALVYSINSVRTKVQEDHKKMTSDYESIVNILNLER